jgi:STE24 endopeptidase
MNDVDDRADDRPHITGMNDAELGEAKRYGRRDLACSLLDKLVDVVYLAAAALVLARPLDAWLQQAPLLARSASLRLLTLLTVVMLLHMLVSFPIVFYSGHVLEHQFRLSTQTFGRWLWRYAKRNLLAVAFSGAAMLGLYWLIWTTGPWWWLTAAGAFFVVTVLLGQLAPVLILPLFYKITKLDQPELVEGMARLAHGTGLSIEGVYRMDLSDETVKANAMLAGLGRTRRVLLGDTLLAGFSPDEIEVIFAHEIGHHVFHHIRKLILGGLLTSAAGFWLCNQLLVAWVARHGGPTGYAQMPTYTLPLVLLILTVFGMLLDPLQNAISRRFERQCDRYALERTGRPDAYRSAFRKLARLNKDDPNPHPLDVLLFHSHPPVAERLALADQLPPGQSS